MADVFIRYVHFLGIMMLMASLVAEHLLIEPRMSGKQIRRLAIIDAIYGISAMLVLAAGLMLWFAVGKPAEVYSKNFVFHIKITLFVLVALVSIYPTRFFARHRKSTAESIEIPKSIIMTIRLQLLFLVLIPLLATLMARGIGYFG